VEGKIPDKIFLTRGAGRHMEKLTSFEFALRAAGLSQFNLVHVSSIFPPHCVLIPRTRGVSMLRAGEIVYCVLSSNHTDERSRLVGSAIGVAIPEDRKRYGYISEHHAFGKRGEELGDYTEDLAATMLASTLGIEIDLTRAWNERKQEWKIARQIVRTTNITQTALGKDGMWTTTVAAAVFCSYKGR
jgi:arginine decarboxylase